MLDPKIELLKQVPLFLGLSDELLREVAGAGKKAFFEPGDNLITAEEMGNTAYLIITGKAICQRIQGGETLIEDLWPGTLVGELGMLVETTYTVTVLAQERVRALAFERDAFKAVLETHPEVAQHIAEKLLVRLHGLAADIRTADEQLARLEQAAAA